MSQGFGPLQGQRVIDFTHMRAGPTCTMMLGDMGAEVIKIEAPAGDGTRRFGRPVAGEGLDFLSVNRNKKSVVLDLKTDDDRAVALGLVATADVVVENFRPGVMESFGLGYEQLAPRFPRLVYCSISGYGRTGPYADRPGYDQIVQGMSGLMSITGTEDSGPLRVGLPIGDLLGGVFAAYGVVLALFERTRSERGQLVHTSLLRGLVSILSFQAARYLLTGEVAGRVGQHHPIIAPVGTFRAAEGLVTISCSTEAQWRQLCRAMDAEDLTADPRFTDNRARVAHRDELIHELEKRLGAGRREEWLARFLAHGVPSGPVYGIDEVFRDPQVQAEGLTVTPERPHPTVGEVPMPGFPVVLERTPARAVLPPPRLGEHTEEIAGPLRARLTSPQ